ncbi:MAG TPA: bifunctional phosphoglucose/phosphomannose isomerase [Candidatus Paceibacterota bacterium]|nr:bifunctional phosphoglucose/phosphomannose isomerase [Candidatus Paceibacterota bacterium]
MNFLESIEKFPQQFLFQPQIKNIERLKKADYFIVLGMGGSALAADLLKARFPKKPLFIHKNYGLPSLAEQILKKSLVIACSYSGNTEEVLDGYNEAQKKKMMVAVISSGGKLLNKAKKNKSPYIQIPNFNIQPRLSLGLMSKALAAFMQDKILFQELSSLARILKPQSFQKQGQKIARTLYKHIPIIYASTANEALAYHWKISFNENTKIPAFYNVFPELNHNELSCFDLHSSTKILSEKFSIVLLEDKKDEPRIQKRVAVLKKILRTNNFNIQEIKLLNHSESEKIFSSVLLANWSSYYLAKKYFIEPESVPLVEKFKKLIK